MLGFSIFTYQFNQQGEMMPTKISLPSSSYDEMVKIIKGYSNIKGPASLDDISKLVGMNRTRVSANNKFLTESGLIKGGNKKTPTELGRKLGRALDHNQKADIENGWESMVSSNEDLAGLITTIRIKGGMTTEELSAHILYVSGQKNNKDNRAGANALVEILKASGLVELSDGTIVVAQPSVGDQDDNDKDIEDTPLEESQGSTDPAIPKEPLAPKIIYKEASPAIPQIAINIQLHLPETENPDVYNNLFKALKDNLFSKGE